MLLPPKAEPQAVQRWVKVGGGALSASAVGERDIGRQACLLVGRKAERAAAGGRSGHRRTDRA